MRKHIKNIVKKLKILNEQVSDTVLFPQRNSLYITFYFIYCHNIGLFIYI